MNIFSRREAPFVFLLIIYFLSSCTKPHFWYLDSNHPSNPCYQSSRLSLPPFDLLKNASVELVSSEDELRMYLNLLVFPLSYNEKTVSIRYLIDHTSGETTAFVMNGGERILLPVELRDLIIDALLRGAPVILKIGSFKFEIPSSNFSELYHRMIE